MAESDPDEGPTAVATVTVEEHPYSGAPIVVLPTELDVVPGELVTAAVFDPTVDGAQIQVSGDDVDPESTSTTPVEDSTPPVTEGQLVDVEIETLGAEGDGVAKVDGFTLFVPGGEPGDELTVEVETIKERFGFATIRARDGSGTG